jgi:hypothetical protein
MKKQKPARILNTQFKKSLTTQTIIAKMIKKKSFKTVRQLLPLKEIQKMVNNLELDAHSRKIKFINLFRAIFYSIVVKNNPYSRSIANVGKTMAGQMFSGLLPVSHVAILDRLNVYDEEKMDALTSQILDGINAGTNRKAKDSSKVKIIDGTSIALSYSRTRDELPPLGKNKLSSEEKIPSKSLLKLGLTIQAGTFIPLDWQFSESYDDNQVFRDLIDWNDKGYTYILDRGNIAVGFLKKFTDNKMYFIQKTYANHTFEEEKKIKLPLVKRVLGRYRVKYEIIGWITREDGLRVKVRRIIAVDNETNEELSLTTNDFDTSPRVIIRQHDRRWEIEVLNDWLKNTIGPDDDHKLTQWSRMQGFRNLLRIWLLILGLLLAYGQKKFGTKWWRPQRFSLGNIINSYEDQLVRWLEGKLGLRHRTLDDRL